MTAQIHKQASPNFDERANGADPDLVVLHYTAMSPCQAALDRLCDAEAKVSAHYLISEKGIVFQLVEEEKRAWHAGQGTWQGRDDVNSRSIGIELDNTGITPFSEPLMSALETLLASILRRWSIPAHGVIGHSDMAPNRKVDPGRRFDWRRLALGGLSIWPDSRRGTGDFASNATAFGYDLDLGEEAALDAFRQRFRPVKAQSWGPPDAIDTAMAANLAARFGIDQIA